MKKQGIGTHARLIVFLVLIVTVFIVHTYAINRSRLRDIQIRTELMGSYAQRPYSVYIDSQKVTVFKKNAVLFQAGYNADKVGDTITIIGGFPEGVTLSMRKDVVILNIDGMNYLLKKITDIGY